MATSDPVDGANVRFPPPLVPLLSILAGVALNREWPIASIPIGSTARIALGVVIVALGVASAMSARVFFVRTGQSVIPYKPTPELIFQGPYRFTRNPMYVGLTLMQIGIGIAMNNLWISLLAAATLAIIHVIAVRPEEAYLSRKFGEPYRQYLTRVRRYI